MINDHSIMRNQRLKAAYVGRGLKTDTKIPSIHRYKLSLDIKNAPDTDRRKMKQTSTRSGIKQSPESNLLLTDRAPNTSHRQLAGFFFQPWQEKLKSHPRIPLPLLKSPVQPAIPEKQGLLVLSCQSFRPKIPDERLRGHKNQERGPQ